MLRAASRRRPPVAPLARVCAALGIFLMSGCAGTSDWGYADDVGVQASLDSGAEGRLSGTLVGLSGRDLVIDTEVDRGEDVEVRRRDGVDYVYARGVVLGTAVEVREFDIVTRRRVDIRDAERLEIESRGYLGWGSALAGVLAFFLVQVLEDQR